VAGTIPIFTKPYGGQSEVSLREKTQKKKALADHLAAHSRRKPVHPTEPPPRHTRRQKTPQKRQKKKRGEHISKRLEAGVVFHGMVASPAQKQKSRRRGKKVGLYTSLGEGRTEGPRRCECT